MKFRLYNTITNSIDTFSPLENDEVRMYSCGPTVYNHAHIGNMRAFLFADLLQRSLKTVGGWKMKWVMNITDIDDKTIRDSSLGSPAWKNEMGLQTEDKISNLKKLTNYFENKFLADISLLGINPEDFYQMPHATDFIPQMQELIRKIFSNGFAYISEGSVYFNVEKWAKADKYGKLKNVDFSNFQKGVRIDADTYERDDANDFVLWKAKKEDEPFWNFELDGISLPGRPGWHLECSTMEFEILGLPFDIHTGGIDLQFPHHEDEIAQSKAGYGLEPNPFWCHNEFLEVEGKKMSKSLGNFFSLNDLIEKGIDPLDIRFAMLSAHYRTKYNFTFDGVASAKKARQRIQEYIYALFINSVNPEIFEIPDESSLKFNFFSEIANDLHTPKALAKLFEFIAEFPPHKLSDSLKSNLIEIFRDINNIFNVWQISEKPEETNSIPPEIFELASERLTAKKEKNWALADQIRNNIFDLGFLIVDTKEGFEIKPKN